MRSTASVTTLIALAFTACAAYAQVPDVEFRKARLGVSEAQFLAVVPNFTCRGPTDERERERGDRICSADGTGDNLNYGTQTAKSIEARFVDDRLVNVTILLEFPSGRKGEIDMLGAQNDVLEVFVSRYGKPDPDQGQLKSKRWSTSTGIVTLFPLESTILPNRLHVFLTSNDYDKLVAERKKPRLENKAKGM